MIRNAHTELILLAFGILLATPQLAVQPAVADDAAPAAGISPAAQAASWLPESVIAFAEVRHLSEGVDMVLGHPLRAQLESLAPVQQLFSSPQFSQFKSGLSLFEAGMGRRWKAVLRDLTKGGVYVAFDAATEGAALLVHANEAETLRLLRDTVKPVIASNNPDALTETSYRDIPVAAVGNRVFVADLSDWMLVTNKRDLGKAILDQYTSPSAGNFASSPRFQEFQEFVSSADNNRLTLRAFLDVQAVRESGAAEQLYSGKTDNYFAEILFGGIVANLAETPWSALQATLDGENLHATVVTPHQTAWTTEQRPYFFGASGQETAKQFVDLPNSALNLVAYRDLAEAWLRAADTMTDKAVEDLARADSQLTTFFAGKDFGEDILGALEPYVQAVAREHAFPAETPTPAIKLPEFALIFNLKSPQETWPELRRVYMSFIGFLNVVGAMQGQPQFDLDWDSAAQNQSVTARYAPNKTQVDWNNAPINYNFSPTITLDGQRFVVASSQSLANSIAEIGESSLVSAAPESANTSIAINSKPVSQILAANREQLIAQNMLEEGHDRAAAEAEIDLLLLLTGLLSKAELSLQPTDQLLQLTLQLDIAQSLEHKKAVDKRTAAQ